MKDNKIQHGFIYKDRTGNNTIPKDTTQIQKNVNKAWGRPEDKKSEMIHIVSNIIPKRGNIFENKRYSDNIDSYLN